MVHSHFLNAAPKCSKAANNQKLAAIMTSVQRIMSITICSALRTVSGRCPGRSPTHRIPHSSTCWKVWRSRCCNSKGKFKREMASQVRRVHKGTMYIAPDTRATNLEKPKVQEGWLLSYTGPKRGPWLYVYYNAENDAEDTLFVYSGWNAKRLEYQIVHYWQYYRK